METGSYGLYDSLTPCSTLLNAIQFQPGSPLVQVSWRSQPALEAAAALRKQRGSASDPL